MDQHVVNASSLTGEKLKEEIELVSPPPATLMPMLIDPFQTEAKIRALGEQLHEENAKLASLKHLQDLITNPAILSGYGYTTPEPPPDSPPAPQL